MDDELTKQVVMTYAPPARIQAETALGRAVGDCLSNHGNRPQEGAMASMNERETMPVTASAELAVDDYDERPVETVTELEALVSLRSELTWSQWKAHPQFKKDRMIREAQRRFGVVPRTAGSRVVLSPATPANDVTVEAPTDAEAELSQDEAFSEVCDAKREAWIEAMEAEAEATEQGRDDAAHGR